MAQKPAERLKEIRNNGTKLVIVSTNEEEVEREILAQTYLFRCLAPETVQNLGATEALEVNRSQWMTSLIRYKSKQKQTIREIHQKFIKIKMKPTKRVMPYQGLAQQFLKSLA